MKIEFIGAAQRDRCDCEHVDCLHSREGKRCEKKPIVDVRLFGIRVYLCEACVNVSALFEIRRDLLELEGYQSLDAVRSWISSTRATLEAIASQDPPLAEQSRRSLRSPVDDENDLPDEVEPARTMSGYDPEPEESADICPDCNEWSDRGDGVTCSSCSARGAQ